MEYDNYTSMQFIYLWCSLFAVGGPFFYLVELCLRNLILMELRADDAAEHLL